MPKTGPGRSYRQVMTIVESFRKFPDDRAVEVIPDIKASTVHGL